MAHQITEHDNVVLHRKRAWHGLGTIVPDALTPIQALDHIGADYGIEQQALFRQTTDSEGNEIYLPVDSHVANVRADLNIESDGCLGVVGKQYHPVQNIDLARFAESLADVGTVKIETAGTLQGGRKIWFLAKGESFSVGNRQADELATYLMVSNAHDGSQSIRVTPTTVRVVCANTWQAVLGRFDKPESLETAAFSMRHTQNVMERLEDAKEALRRFGQSMEETRQFANELASRHVKPSHLEMFFKTMYVDHQFSEKRVDKYLKAFEERFEREIEVSGASWWTAANAWSGMLQHDVNARGSDDQARVERHISSNLFGLNAQRTNRAFIKAAELALVS